MCAQQISTKLEWTLSEEKYLIAQVMAGVQFKDLKCGDHTQSAISSKMSRLNLKCRKHKKRPKSQDAGIRPCMSCKKDFLSESSANRRCPACKNLDSSYGFYSQYDF